MHEFFAMGGYAGYVWGSFGITLAVLAGNLWFAQRRHAAVLRRLRRQAEVESPDARSGFKEVMT